MPAGGEGQADGEVNVVQAEQDPNQVSEDLPANLVPEGKPRSMSHFSNYATMLCLCLCIYVSGVELKP